LYNDLWEFDPTCVIAMFSEDGIVPCTPCDRGKYSNITGAKSCIPCDIGTFANVTGLSACFPCEAGTYSSSTNSQDCIPCNFGTCSTAGSDSCNYCSSTITLIVVIPTIALIIAIVVFCIFFRRLKKVYGVAYTEEEMKELFGGELEIFISYQWDHQETVKKIKNSLDSDFKVWMDVEKMVMGDNLFEAMEKGIRSAKIILMCISKPYTKSVNCKKEADLASALKKPIVPLLMSDDVIWPPEGLGTIVGGLLYKDFRSAKLFDSLMEDLKNTLKEKLNKT